MSFKLIFIAALSLCLIILPSCNGKKQSGPAAGVRRSSAVSVDVLVLKPDSLSNVIYTTGTLLPNEKIELRNEVSGRVTGIFFDEGSEVTKGTVLFKINDRDLQAQLAKNAVQEQLASDDESRKRKLLDIKAISQEEYDVSANQLKSVQAEKQVIEAQIAKTEIIAPVTGRIGLRYVSPGGFIPSNTLIAILQQVDPIKIEFTIPEKYHPLIRQGMEIIFNMDYSPKTFTGRVYAVESGVDAVTRTVRVRAICPNPGRILVPGTFARITLILEEITDAIKIPSETMLGDINGDKVFIVRGGKATSVQVTAGIRTNKDVQITSGLQPGDSLILTGLLQIIDGTPVVTKKRGAEKSAGNNQK